MAQAKKLKKAVRARAKKTGERYAAARRQVLAARDRRAARKGAAPRSAANAAARASATGGAGDARVRARTGHSLDHWFEVLDRFGATQKGHTATARHLVQDHGSTAGTRSQSPWPLSGRAASGARIRG